MPRYRIIMQPMRRPATSWRETEAEAIADGIRKKLIERDEHVEGRYWWHPNAEIEVHEDG